MGFNLAVQCAVKLVPTSHFRLLLRLESLLRLVLIGRGFVGAGLQLYLSTGSQMCRPPPWVRVLRRHTWFTIPRGILELSTIHHNIAATYIVHGNLDGNDVDIIL